MFTRTIRNFVDTTPRFRHSDETGAECVACGSEYPLRRHALGYDTCLACSSEKPMIANQALHKQGYTFSSNIDNIRENPYSTHK